MCAAASHSMQAANQSAWGDEHVCGGARGLGSRRQPRFYCLIDSLRCVHDITWDTEAVRLAQMLAAARPRNLSASDAEFLQLFLNSPDMQLLLLVRCCFVVVVVVCCCLLIDE